MSHFALTFKAQILPGPAALPLDRQGWLAKAFIPALGQLQG